MFKIKSYVWNTTKICETFNVSGSTTLSETYEGIVTGIHFPGMLGQKHSEETKKKMSEAAHKNKPHLHKGGKIIKDNNIYEFTCLSHACKDLNLSIGHLCEVMSGKRKSVKGWKKYVS